jgi:hypothetical protein
VAIVRILLATRTLRSLQSLLKSRAARARPAGGSKVAVFLRRHAPLALLALILVAGGWLRLSGTNWDDGGHLHPDERYLSMVADNIRWPRSPGGYLDVDGSRLSPYNTEVGRAYVYGTLPLFATKLAATALGRDDYGNLNLVGRRLSALADLLTVALVYLITLVALERFGRTAAVTGALLAAALYAATVAAIQSAHFFTADSWTVLLTLATFYLAAASVRAGVPAGAARFSLRVAVVGVALGLTVACKLSGVFVAVPVAVAILGRGALARGWASTREVLLRVGADLLLVAAAAYGAFRAASPYAFARSNWLDVRVNSGFLAALETQQNALDGASLYPPSYQWLLSSRFWDPLRNLVIWQLGIPFGLVALAGLVAVGVAAARSVPGLVGRRNHASRPPTAPAVAALTVQLMMLAYVTIVFGYVGSLFAHTGRYLLPILPLLAVAAACGLVTMLGAHRRLMLAVGAVVVVATSTYAVAFRHVYAVQNTRMAASDWIVAHVPAGASIVNEHWDDPLPVGASAQRYVGVELPAFDADDETKMRKLYDGLQGADYYVLSSPRAWNTIGRLPSRFPLMTRFYERLFDNRLGYSPSVRFTVHPQLFGVSLDDLGAEEAFWVYDHPPVIIFRHERRLSWDDFRAQLCGPPRPTACG